MRDLSEEIIELISPPPTPSELRWERAEAEIGARIPSDYKALLAGLGGAGEFDECLCLFEPDSRLTGWDLANLVAERDAVWQYLKDRGRTELPEKYFNKNVRLIPFALSEQNVFYWIALSGRLEDESAVLFVNADIDDWLEFDKSATEVIYDLLHRRIRHYVFDEYFSDLPHTYERF
ncbi:SMI1/KNR4 family protein [Actinoplanes awajinensis]|uniref:Knr4/Smi1-like domain-containing protein n=1 Tax=Actinoplanes awajinensis subsp. mycoplanecinus TaxID=135947 RepID=A0A0X3UP30_9ACTN|nr:SMI1/KNR4 family protein [Actinoplanes awajinensis]KUL34250.1 hypothetical protein ADL15_16585 [Actinoplanes awajinensis subsp. mycoplanecinus]